MSLKNYPDICMIKVSRKVYKLQTPTIVADVIQIKVNNSITYVYHQIKCLSYLSQNLQLNDYLSATGIHKSKIYF